MKLALEDIQRGMGLIMEKHRNAVRDFERSNVLLELMERRFDEVISFIRLYFLNFWNFFEFHKIVFSRFYKLLELNKN
jgi:hypothetical protein